jgi:hypothetical protein
MHEKVKKHIQFGMLAVDRFRVFVFFSENPIIIVIFPVSMGVKLGLSRCKVEGVCIQEGRSYV